MCLTTSRGMWAADLHHLHGISNRTACHWQEACHFAAIGRYRVIDSKRSILHSLRDVADGVFCYNFPNLNGSE